MVTGRGWGGGHSMVTSQWPKKQCSYSCGAAACEKVFCLSVVETGVGHVVTETTEITCHFVHMVRVFVFTSGSVSDSKPSADLWPSSHRQYVCRWLCQPLSGRLLRPDDVFGQQRPAESEATQFNADLQLLHVTWSGGCKEEQWLVGKCHRVHIQTDRLSSFVWT